MEVKETIDYKQFRLLKDNRQIKRSHVERLKDSIARNNLLNINPILVNEDLQVIDGQHRLMAAMELKIPIYYQMAYDVEPSAVQVLNTVKMNWNWKDYVHSYVAIGLEEYIWLQITAEHYVVSPNLILRLLVGKQPNCLVEMKRGELVVEDKVGIVQQLEMLLELSKFYAGFDRSEFVKAFRLMINTPGFKWEHFLEQVSKYPSSIFNCVTFTEHLIQLEKIYNRGLHGKNKIRMF